MWQSNEGIRIAHNWENIDYPHNYVDDLIATNPNYNSTDTKFADNCQRCVPTYELRRRGIDVEALPNLGNDDINFWMNIFRNGVFEGGVNKSEIEQKLKKWGNGARAEIYVVWKNSSSSHVFVGENINGEIIYTDPQCGSINIKKAKNVEKYFDEAEEKCMICRIDNLEINPETISTVCKRRKK